MEDVIFIESSEFTAWVGEYLADDALAALQRTLRVDPNAGAVMPGCGGLRKIRVADPGRGKGKRGGARVIYLYIPEAHVIHHNGHLRQGRARRPVHRPKEIPQGLRRRAQTKDDSEPRGGVVVMKDPKQRKPLGERLKDSLEEALRHHRGEITLKTTVLPWPSAPPEIDAKTVTGLRERSGMSQREFARVLNVSTKTVQSWEQGVRAPSQAARRLIQIYCEHPEAVCQSVGIPPVALQGVTIEEVAPGRRKLVVGDAPTERRNRRKSPVAEAARTKTETSR